MNRAERSFDVFQRWVLLAAQLLAARGFIAVAGFIAIAVSAGGCVPDVDDGAASVEKSQTDGAITYVDQGWSLDERKKFHHEPVGSGIVPSAWVPHLKLADGSSLFSATTNAKSGQLNPSDASGLDTVGIIGGAISPGFEDEHRTYWGVTCAWCHTTDIHFGERTIRIDGAGAASNDGFKFFALLGEALGVAKPSANNGRFDEFAAALGVPGPQRDALGAEVEIFAEVFRKAGEIKANPVDGPGRGDGVTAVINAAMTSFVVNGMLVEVPGNRYDRNAPVAQPSIWRTNNNEWFHWTSSIKQPLARDVWTTSAFSLRRVEDWQGDPKSVDSFVDIDAIAAIREKLETLKAPAWPEEILGSLDKDKVTDGKALFATHCGSCHDGQKYLGEDPFAATYYDIDGLGTDTAAIEKLALTGFDMRAIGGQENMKLTDAFALLTNKILERRYVELEWDQEKKTAATRGQPNDWRRVPGYQAPELCGVWSTPPYGHANTIASLEQMLTHPSARLTSFYVGGARQYDPDSVGYVTEQQGLPGEHFLDTTVNGNLATGHDYGTYLAPEEKDQLIEYLKARTCDEREGAFLR